MSLIVIREISGVDPLGLGLRNRDGSDAIIVDSESRRLLLGLILIVLDDEDDKLSESDILQTTPGLKGLEGWKRRSSTSPVMGWSMFAMCLWSELQLRPLCV